MAVRRRKPHYHVDMDIDPRSRPVTLDARSLTLPSVAIIAIVSSSVVLTYFLAEERSRLDTRIDSVINSVERLAVSISQLADGLKLGVSDRFTTTHHDLWCAKAENLNRGFKCPETNHIMTAPTSTLNQTLQGVGNEMNTVIDKIGRQKRGGE